MKKHIKNSLILVSLLGVVAPISIISARCEDNKNEEKSPHKNPEVNPNPNPAPNPTPQPNPQPTPNPNPAPKPNLDKKWKEEKFELNGISVDKFGGLISLYNLKSNLSVTDAISLLKESKKDTKEKVEISNIKIEAYDEKVGELEVSLSIKIDNNIFNNKSVKLSGFKKIEIFTRENIILTFNKEKLFETNKKIEELKDNELLDYITIEGISSTSHQKLNLVSLTKTSPKNYFFAKEGQPRLSSDKKSIIFTFVSKYAAKEKGTEEKDIEERLEVFNKPISGNTIISEKEALDFIIEKHIVVKKDILKNMFPSSFLHFYRKSHKIVDNFVQIDNTKNDYFKNKDGEHIEFDNQRITVNDLAGSLEISFNLKMKNNGKEYHSKTRIFSFTGFKKLDSKYLENFDINLNTTDTQGKNFIKRIQNEYNKSQSISLQEVVKYLNINNMPNKNLLRMINEDNENAQLQSQTHSIIKLYGNTSPIEDVIKNETQLDLFKGKNEFFEISNLDVEFKNIEIKPNGGTKVFIQLYYNLNFILSSHNQNISIPKVTTISFNKN
ncbi:Hypothetical protein, predicted lipoprotein [Metamycoplasma auris 15026]|uniref:Uncharacterized protein n=1 Tax=Metamycoplasma auris 15026 TaxID=1188233 RepID=N9VCW8_9BACT|nr:lipoprotein 17-related variable surface protein [Metamycoplasma auris]ENY69236.1 Hypothetical protein, predicted lipoprotein [Metamycoplasma auris 15026]